MSDHSNNLLSLFRADYRVFWLATQHWLHGGDPYARLAPDLAPGRFAYPPTFLTWATPLSYLGPSGYWLWTACTVAGWAYLMRRSGQNQWPLLIWSPIFLHLWIGQSTLTFILVLWAAHLARPQRESGTLWRSLAWGLALAWCATKPQTAFLPLLALLWDERNSPRRLALWSGLLGGTVLLALPPTLHNPHVWADWIGGVKAYHGYQVQLAPWQGPSIVLWALAGWLWWRNTRGETHPAGNWRWWLTATAFPQTTFYTMVALMPVMDIRRNRWHMAGLLLAALVQGQTGYTPLMWILAIHALAAWMVVGGPKSADDAARDEAKIKAEAFSHAPISVTS